MKFSYTLLKSLVPTLPPKGKLADILNEKVFEVESIEGDAIDISLPPNRYADAASLWGMARQISAALGKPFKEPAVRPLAAKGQMPLSIAVKEKALCPRYMAAYCTGVQVGPSPAWLKKALASSGINSINNVVDVLNYVMLETGQPLHAFDIDALEGGIQVRRAHEGEGIETLDGRQVNLPASTLVIADAAGPLAIAGIKGGKRAEVHAKTSSIIIESANFDASSIYRSSRQLGLVTDASLRFSRKLSPASCETALARATSLLHELAGAKAAAQRDVCSWKSSRTLVLFDVAACQSLIGEAIPYAKIASYLKLLGFSIIADPKWPIQEKFFVEAPQVRLDIERFADLVEEVVRIHGLSSIPSLAPRIALGAAHADEAVAFKDRVKRTLAGMGFSEVILSSFTDADRKDADLAELANPPSSLYRYLRPSLQKGMAASIQENLKHFAQAQIFEMGHVFEMRKGEMRERLMLGIGWASRATGSDPFFGLKGALVELFRSLGLTDWNFAEALRGDGKRAFGEGLDIVVDGKRIGALVPHALSRGQGAYAELDCEELQRIQEGEYEYRPIPRFPAIERDLSMLVDRFERIGTIIQEISLVDASLIRDVDLVDEYEGDPIEEGKRSITVRIVFQSPERTLTDSEADGQMDAIRKMLESRFDARIR
jgi:phenylalanyl-tRNA synthetase beta chain